MFKLATLCTVRRYREAMLHRFLRAALLVTMVQIGIGCAASALPRVFCRHARVCIIVLQLPLFQRGPPTIWARLEM
jgi:hypothetical protein